MALKQEFPTVNVSYEALLSHPGKSLTLIKDHFSLNPKHKEFKNLNQSTKDPQKTFMDYQDYYLPGAMERPIVRSIHRVDQCEP